MTRADPAPPAFADVQAAALRLQGLAHRTPVRTSATIDHLFGATVLFKCEDAQRAGAFKFRGACNALAQLEAPARAAGVVAYSSGNHAQAVALAADIFGIPATIVMPHDAPAIKVAATRQLGATVIGYDRYTEDRVAICQALADQHGLSIIPPFDHPDVIAGQGTVAMELLEDAGGLDALFMPLGGGGLLAGSLLAAEALDPRCRVYGVEPLAGNDGQRSLRAGVRLKIDTPVTIADGAQTQQLGQLTFPIIQRAVADILAVEDAALVEAMRTCMQGLQMIAEPTGCLGLAGALAMRPQLRGKRIGIIVSGGNIDPAEHARLLAVG